MKKLLMLLSLFLGFSSMQAMDFLKTKTGRIGSFIVLAGVTYGIYTKYFKGAPQLPATAAPKPTEPNAKQSSEPAKSAMPVAKSASTSSTVPWAIAALVDQRPELPKALKDAVLADINAGFSDEVILKKYGQYRFNIIALKDEAALKLTQSSISKKLEPKAESPTNPLPKVLKPQIRNLFGSRVPKADLIKRYSQYTDAKQFIESL